MSTETATREITVSGFTLPVPTRYSEGHKLNELEAAALNKTLAEGVGSRMRKAVEDAKNADGKVPDDVAPKLIEIAAGIAAEFDFSRVVRAKASVDPVQREALSLARAHVTAKIKSTDFGTLKNFIEAKDAELGEGKGKEYVDEKVREVAAMPQVQAAAKKAVAEQAKLQEALAEI